MNIITTVPVNKYPTWTELNYILERTDGEPHFWLINCRSKPTRELVGKVCFMLYRGEIKGYMDIVDVDLSENYRSKHRLGKYRPGYSIVLANFHPCLLDTGLKSFMGYRYTDITP